MSVAAIQTPSKAYKLGWWVLFALSVLSVGRYTGLIFVTPALVDSFVAWATFSLYSVFVLFIPYRRAERWAWYITWALPIPSVVLSLNNPNAAPYYLTVVGLMVIVQFLTRGAFITNE
jgi:hypothetical protein